MAQQLKSAAPVMAAMAVAVLAGVLVASQATTTLSVAAWLGLLGLGALAFLGPRTVLAVLAALVPFAPATVLAELGPLEIRLWDPLFALLCMQLLFMPRRTSIIRRAIPAVALLLVILASSLALFLQDEAAGIASVIAWARLVQTALLVPIAAWVLEPEGRARLICRGLALGGSALVIATSGSLLGSGADLMSRPSPFANSNTLGLVSGLLVVMALAVRSDVMSGWERWASLVAGLVGLLLAESLSSLFAVGVGVVAAIFLSRRQESAAPLGVGLGALLSFLLIASGVLLLYPATQSESTVLRSAIEADASLTTRSILAQAALDAFAESPLLGMGWQQTSNFEVLGAQSVMRKPGAVAVLAAIRDGELSPSAHNAYIQTLAELGVVGLLFLIWMVYGLARLAARALEAAGSREGTLFLVSGLLVLATWWNGSSLYGSQTESMTLALCVGALLAIESAFRDSHETGGA